MGYTGEIVNDGVHEDLVALSEELIRLDKQLKDINGQTISIIIDLKGAENLTRLTSLIEQQNEQYTKLNAVIAENATITQNYSSGQIKVAGHIAATTGEVKQLQNELKQLEKIQGTLTKNSTAWKEMGAEIEGVKNKINALGGATNQVNVQVNKTSNAFTVMGVNAESVLARMTVRMVAMQLIFAPIIAVITVMVEGFLKLSDAEQEAADRLKDYQDKFKEVQKAQAAAEGNIMGGILFDNAKAQEALQIANDTTKSITERRNAYTDLQKIMPEMLHNLTEEQEKNGKFLADADKVNKAIRLQNELKEAANQIELKNKALATNQALIPQLEQNVRESQDPNNVKNFNPTKYKNELIEGQTQQVQLIKDVNDAQKNYNKTYEEYNKLRVIDDKVKKAKKPNAKDLESELALEQQEYKVRKDLLQKQYDQSRKTFDDERRFDEDQRKAAQVHADKMYAINEKWHGKVGEDEHRYQARRAQVAADQLAVDNALNENDRKIALEIQKRHDQAAKDIDELVKKMREQQQALRDIQRETDEIKADAAAHKERAGGYSPLLEALGFDADFKENQASFDRQIAAAKQKKAELTGAQYNAYLSGNSLEYGKATENVDNAGKDIAQLEADKQKAIDDKIIAAKREAAEKTIELTQQTFAAIKQIQEQQFAWEQQQIQFKMESVQLQSKQQMDTIDATTNFAIVKDNQKAKLAAQTAAEENALQAKSNELKIKQARWEKRNAEMTILANTAMAEIKTLAAYAGIPGGIAIALPIMALEAAIGAAQYAAAASAPEPQFEKGGAYKGSRTGKLIAGEKGAELGFTPSGGVLLFDKPGRYGNVPIGTNIKTADETKRIIQYAINGIGFNGGSLSALQEKKEQAMTDKRIVEKLDEVSDNIIQAAMIGRVIKNNVTVSLSNDLQRN